MGLMGLVLSCDDGAMTFYYLHVWTLGVVVQGRVFGRFGVANWVLKVVELLAEDDDVVFCLLPIWTP